MSEGVAPVDFEVERGVTEFKVAEPSPVEVRLVGKKTLEAHSRVTGWLSIPVEGRGALADDLIRLAGAIRRGENASFE